MENTELKEALDALALDIKGKTAVEVKDAIEAFKAEAKNLFAGELKEVQEAMEAKMDAMQAHADKLDVRIQNFKAGAAAGQNSDPLKEVITKSFDEIKGVKKGKGMEVKAPMLLTTNLTGDQNREYQSTVAMIPGQAVNFEQLVQTINIGVGTYTYPRETAVTGAVGEQTEGTDKEEVTYELAMIDANPEFISGFTRYSKKMANNLPYLEGFLPTALRREYFMSENSIFYTDLEGLATDSTLLLGNVVERIINEAVTLMALNYVPNRIVISPKSYGEILLTAGTDGTGQYSLPGVVTISNGIISINGIQVIVATWMPADHYIIGQWDYCQKIVTEGLSLGFYEQDQDNIIKNLITARIESQSCISVQRTDAFIAGDFTTVA